MSDRILDVRSDRIRQAVAKLTDGRGRRYPRELRSQIAELARARLKSGSSRLAVCQELGVSDPTLVRILAKEPPTMRRVRLAEPTSTLVNVGATKLVVRGPCGVVVEGLDTAGIAALMRALS